MSSPPSKKEFIQSESFALEEECLIQETEKEKSVDDLKEKVIELEKSIVEMNIDHGKAMGEKKKQLDILNKAMDTVKKENGSVKKELKLLREENTKLNQELGKIQYDKDRLDAEVKSEEKLRKIKKNTKLFNDIIKKTA